MTFVLLILAAALVTGLLLGGDLRRLEGVRLHWWGAALAGLAVQLLTPSTAWQARGLVLLTYGLLLSFVVVNRRLPAAFVLAIGLVMNLSASLPTGSMPVSAAAIHAAGGHDLAVAGARHHLATGDEVLLPFGDVIPVPEPIGVVLSIGDALVYGAIAWFVVAVMRGRSVENPRAPSRWMQGYRGKHEAPPARRATVLRAPRIAAARWGTGP
jgi:hypothetical protein